MLRFFISLLCKNFFNLFITRVHSFNRTWIAFGFFFFLSCRKLLSVSLSVSLLIKSLSFYVFVHFATHQISIFDPYCLMHKIYFTTCKVFKIPQFKIVTSTFNRSSNIDENIRILGGLQLTDCERKIDRVIQWRNCEKKKMKTYYSSSLRTRRNTFSHIHPNFLCSICTLNFLTVYYSRHYLFI